MQEINSTLLVINISTVQSSAQTFIHNAIFFIDTSNNAWYNQAHLADQDAIFVNNY